MEVALLLWKESVQRTLETGQSLREAALDLGAQPRFYTQLLKIPAWYWLSPMRRYKILRSKALLRLMNPASVADSHPLVREIETHLVYLEFGGEHLALPLRTEVRRAALSNEIGMRKVRSAFRSMAVVRSRNGRLVRRTPSAGILQILTLVRDFSVGFLLAVLAYVIQTVMTQGCIDCTALAAIFTADLMFVSAMVFTTLGPNWHAGDELLSRLGASQILSP